MPRKEKIQVVMERMFAKQLAESCKQDEFENYRNCISFLQNVPTTFNDVEEAKRQKDLLQLQTVISLGNYFKELSIQLRENNADSNIKNRKIYEIDTSKLYVGMIIKNFRELCRIVGIPENKIPTAKGQYEDKRKILRRYFDFYEMKNNNQIIILEIYSEPLEKTRNTGKYLKETQILILDFLLNEARKHPKALDKNGYMEIKTTYSKLLKKQLKLINPCFSIENFLSDFFTEKYPEYFEEANAIYNLRNIYSRLFSKTRGAVHTALYKLNSIGEMLDVEEYYIVKIVEHTEEKGEVYEWIEINNQKEKNYIKNTKKDIAESLGYKNSWQVFFNGKGEEYDEKFNETIRKQKGWNEVRYRVSIGFNVNHILKYLNEYNTPNYKEILFENFARELNKQALDLFYKDETQYIAERERYIETEKKFSFLSNKSLEDLENQYDSKYYFKRTYKKSFPDAQKLITAFTVNPREEQITELKEYKKDWLKKKDEKIIDFTLDEYEDEELN